MATDPVAWTVRHDAAAVMQSIAATLGSLGYAITPSPDGWSGRAEVGSGTARVLAGGFARRMIIDYALSQGPTPETLAIHLRPGMTCVSGGLIGMSRAKKDYAAACEAVHQALGHHRLLAG